MLATLTRQSKYARTHFASIYNAQGSSQSFRKTEYMTALNASAAANSFSFAQSCRLSTASIVQQEESLSVESKNTAGLSDIDLESKSNTAASKASDQLKRPLIPIDTFKSFELDSTQGEKVHALLHPLTQVKSIGRLSLSNVPKFEDLKNAWWKYPYVQSWLHSFKTGAFIGLLELDRTVFGVKVRPDILAQVLKYERDWHKQGTESSKALGQVRGSTRKPFPQKGRGKARVGTIRAPQFVGGMLVL
ncbi:ribosomal protein L4/L1 family protein, variant [Batrachochytrium dendrobatidis JEL423]|uniref:Large ribosomal subunit protein uL4m n=1 Tax=Batrachochytrium dendrobatidis (strain JEL423) TaxID=403673 RepID=A0A177WFI3_BATDL|nr:ribosomal protein L4/L1 family protein, variant [Batrachochytrium dendrobatidis JEL423]